MTITLTLLAPLGLAALFALALPLLIHLVRRIELRTTEFAALRWISERIRPRRRLRFERPWLLLLRLALLALCALLLARPIVTEPSVSKPAWVLVAPGSDLGAAHAALSLEDAEWHWLAPGFPPVESALPSAAVPTASLLRELDANLPLEAKLAVVVPEDVSGLDGERPELAHAVDWHVVRGRMPAAIASARSGALSLSVRYAPAAEPAVRYLRAAIAALEVQHPGQHTLDAAAQDVALPDTTHDLVWLGSAPPQAVTDWVEAGGTAIVDAQPRATGAPIWRDAHGDVLARVQPLGRGRLVSLSGALSPQTFPALLDADFPQRLADLLQPSVPAPTRASADALRPALATSATQRDAMPAGATKPLDPWLVLLIAGLFLVERFVATRPEPAA